MIKTVCSADGATVSVERISVYKSAFNNHHSDFFDLNLHWTSGRMLAAIYYTDEDTNQDIDILSYTYDENGNVTNQLIFIYDSDEEFIENGRIILYICLFNDII